MLGKPGRGVVVLTEECFVGFILGLLRKGNKKLTDTTRGLCQPSYRGSAGGTKAVTSSSAAEEPWGFIEAREISGSLLFH